MREGRRGKGLLPVALLALIAAAALAGCGGGGSTTPTAAGPGATAQTTEGAKSATAVAARRAHSRATATVATVERTPITRASFYHWFAVTAHLNHSRASPAAIALKDQTLSFLITSEWVFGEARAMGVSVSPAEARQRLAQTRSKQFPKESDFKRFLASSGETEADLLQRATIELLESKIAARVTAGKTASTEVHALLSAFQRSFETRWRARTSCRPGYVMEDCREFKSTLHSSSASGSAATSSSSSGATGGRANSRGEAHAASGAMALSSPAFPSGGAIPAQYTCDGAGTSPPVQWQNLPAHTVELVLFVIDDSANNAQGGIRWVVAGLDPSSSGIAAGSLPAGAIVGRNNAGQASYGAICPAKGRRDTVELVLWALSKKISLSSGFTAAVAEQEYSHSELGSAVLYATYTRQ